MIWDKIKENIFTSVAQYGFQVVGALVILILGYLFARWLGGVLERWMTKRDMDPPVRNLMVRLTKLLVLSLALMMALTKFGVDILPLIAGLSVIGVGVGLAAQGVLGNLVAGLTIIITKPYRVGQYVELLGVEGLVDRIDLFTTTLAHADKSLVVVPNRKVVGEIMHNYGQIRQLSLTLYLSNAGDITKALGVIRQVLAANARVLKEPTAVVGVKGVAPTNISLAVCPWVNANDYGPAQAEIYQALVEQFRAAGILVPFGPAEIKLVGATA